MLFGGACAGLAGGYLSLVYTPQWAQAMTAGRGWIALALVVFATWLPGRLVLGALLFGAVSILQLHAQAFGVAGPVAVPLGAAVSDDRARPGHHFAQPHAAPRQYARLPRPAFRAGSLMR